jgi:hypothetical protein
MSSLLFWDVTQPGVVVGYQCFGTAYQYCIQGSRDRDGTVVWKYFTLLTKKMFKAVVSLWKVMGNNPLGHSSYY